MSEEFTAMDLTETEQSLIELARQHQASEAAKPENHNLFKTYQTELFDARKRGASLHEMCELKVKWSRQIPGLA